MESQIVVDHTAVDGNGFVIGGVGNDAHPMDEVWAQIRSLERRANSKDSEALTLNENAEADRIDMLRAECRELRNEAQRLKKAGPWTGHDPLPPLVNDSFRTPEIGGGRQSLYPRFGVGFRCAYMH